MAAEGRPRRVRLDGSEQVHTLLTSESPTKSEFEEQIYQTLHAGEEGVTSGQVTIIGDSSGHRPLPEGDVIYTLDREQHAFFRVHEIENMPVQPQLEAFRRKLVAVMNILLFSVRGLTPCRRWVLDVIRAVLAPRPAVQEADAKRKITVRNWCSREAFDLWISTEATLVDVEEQVFNYLQRTDIKADQVVLFKETPRVEFPDARCHPAGDEFVYYLLLADSSFPFHATLTKNLNELLGPDPSPMRRQVLLALQAFLDLEGEEELLSACNQMGQTESRGTKLMIQAVARASKHVAQKGKPLTPQELADRLLKELSDRGYASGDRARRADVDKEKWRDFLRRHACSVPDRR